MMASTGGSAVSSISENAPVEDHGDGGADQQAEAVVFHLVAGDGVADLELHDRRARQLGHEPRAVEAVVHRLLDLADDLRSGPAPTTVSRSSAMTMRASSPSAESSLSLMISLARTSPMSAS